VRAAAVLFCAGNLLLMGVPAITFLFPPLFLFLPAIISLSSFFPPLFRVMSSNPPYFTTFQCILDALPMINDDDYPLILTSFLL
jgi:hypothetical protein